MIPASMLASTQDRREPHQEFLFPLGSGSEEGAVPGHGPEPAAGVFGRRSQDGGLQPAVLRMARQEPAQRTEGLRFREQAQGAGKLELNAPVGIIDQLQQPLHQPRESNCSESRIACSRTLASPSPSARAVRPASRPPNPSSVQSA